MKTKPTHSKIYTPLDVDSDVLVTVNDSRIRVKADGNYVVFSGNVLRALLSMRKNNGMIGYISKIIESADLIFSHVDINICLYNERFAVMGPETKPFVNWAKSAIVRFLNKS